MNGNKQVVLIGLGILFAAQVNAASSTNTTYIRNGNIYTNEGAWFVEAGAGHISELYDGTKSKKMLPLLNGGYHGEDLNLDAAGINYRFYGETGDVFNLSTYLRPGSFGYSSGDATVLKGMDKRKISVDLGLNVDVQLGDGTLSAHMQHDIASAYKGMQSGLTYFHPMALGSVDFVPFAGVSYLSSKYVDYYFGVKSNEQTASRSAYKGKGTAAYNVGYKLVFPVTENFNISQTSAYTRLGSGISDSPLIKSNNQWVVGLTASYHF